MTNVAPNTQWCHGYDGFHSQAPRDHGAGKPATSTEGSNLDAHWIARCDPSAHAVEFSKTAARSHGGDSSIDLRYSEQPEPLADRTRQYSAPRGPIERAPGRGAGTSAAGSIDRSAGRNAVGA